MQNSSQECDAEILDSTDFIIHFYTLLVQLENLKVFLHGNRWLSDSPLFYLQMGVLTSTTMMFYFLLPLTLDGLLVIVT